MFCSKCGKEINESAAFCDKCGNAVTNSATEEKAVENARLAKKLSDLAGKERNDKIIAIFAAIFCYIVTGIFIFLAVNNITTLISGPRIEKVEEAFAESTSTVMICFILPLSIDIGFYIYAYFNRCFEKFFKNIIITAVISALIPLFLSLIALNTLNEGMSENEYTVTFVFMFMYAVLICAEVFSVITYKKAMDSEETACYHEKKDTLKSLRCLSNENDVCADWKCKNCGSTNKSAQDYCKDCGKYR